MICEVRIQDSESKDANKSNRRHEIYITDAVNIDVSATEIRRKIRENESGWRELVPREVAKYIEKYEHLHLDIN